MLGADAGTALVVRRRARGLRYALAAAVALIGAFALYVMYELGRFDAGYDRQAVAQQRTELEVRIEHLEKDNREMRTRLAEFDTIRLGRAREQAGVAKAIGDLQAQVAHQQQQLAFYRGVVAQGAATIGVKIEELRITAAAQPGNYVAHLSLVRLGRAESMASGTVQFTLEGTQQAQAQALDLLGLTDGKLRELRYNFRYLQSFDQPLDLPAGFKPERLTVELHAARRDVAPLSQTFLWSVETIP